MRRAGTFAVLVLLLLAVAGISAAQEGVFSGEQSGKTNEASSPEPTRPESSKPEKAALEKASGQSDNKNRSLREENKGKEQPTKAKGAPTDKAADQPVIQPQIADQAQFVVQPNLEERPENIATEPEGVSIPQGDVETEGKGKTENRGKAKGKGKAESKGKGKAEGKGKAGDEIEEENEVEEEDEVDGGGGQPKVTLCHKGKKTLTVGAPAESAHLRHGDSLGACA